MGTDRPHSLAAAKKARLPRYAGRKSSSRGGATLGFTCSRFSDMPNGPGGDPLPHAEEAGFPSIFRVKRKLSRSPSKPGRHLCATGASFGRCTLTREMPPTFDEMYGNGETKVRQPFETVKSWLAKTSPEVFAEKRREADLTFQRIGITFNVYGETGGTERLIPFDIVPRILSAREWRKLALGLEQRVRALNLFLHDIYHDQRIVREGVIPAAHILRNALYRPEMVGVDVACDVYTHIAGIDLVRVGEDDFYVLEDNLRTPSGVSYMLENRAVMIRLFPELFRKAP